MGYSSMTEKQVDDYIKRMKEAAKKLASSPKESEQFLLQTGIYTAKGKLTKKYR